MGYVKSFAWASIAAIAASVFWIVLGLAFGIDEIRATSSGGLGAVSVGLSEAVLEAGPVTFVVVFVWRLIRTRRERSK